MLTLVLLAGGSSSRFRPLTEKNLYPFLGKTLVRIQLERSEVLAADKKIIISNDENYEPIKGELASLKLEAEVRKQAGEGQAGGARARDRARRRHRTRSPPPDLVPPVPPRAAATAPSPD